MKKYFKINGLIIALLLFINTDIYSQRDYATGIGIRSWPYWGVSFKHFVTDQTALEIVGSSQWEGVMFDGMYTFHHNVFNTSNFNLLYGGGGHVGIWGSDVVNHPWLEVDENLTIGINLQAGLEYTFDEIPFSITFDWKPLLVLLQSSSVQVENVSFTIRYTIK